MHKSFVMYLATEENFEVELINVYGQVLIKMKNTKSIKVDGLAPGTYIVKLKTEKSAKLQHIIIY